jgi:hypothetical protein
MQGTGSLWIAMIVVLIVPWLAITKKGRAWFVTAPQAVFFWLILATAAGVGLLGWLGKWPRPVEIGSAILVGTPVLQALAYVTGDGLFRWIMKRPPWSYDAVRYRRRSDAAAPWPDRIFWLLMFLGLIAGGVILCASYGVEFPSRYSRH